jgi:uncharacterized protein
MISVEVAYALPEEQTIIALDLPEGATVLRAIQVSQLLERFPSIDLSVQSVGIFGRLVTLETLLEEGDRVEIYCPLRVDPMEARRARAKQQRKKGGQVDKKNL